MKLAYFNYTCGTQLFWGTSLKTSNMIIKSFEDIERKTKSSAKIYNKERWDKRYFKLPEKELWIVITASNKQWRVFWITASDKQVSIYCEIYLIFICVIQVKNYNFQIFFIKSYTLSSLKMYLNNFINNAVTKCICQLKLN